MNVSGNSEQEEPGEETALLSQGHSADSREQIVSNQNNDFALLDRRVPWFRVALLLVSGAFSLPTFVAGIDIMVETADGRIAVLAIMIGNVLLAMVAGTCGFVGAQTRLHSYALAQVAFGRQGAAIFNLVFAFSLVGWFGVNLNLFTNSVMRLLPDQADGQMMYWVPLVGGAVMTLTTLHGFRALERLSLLLAPILALVTALLLIESCAKYNDALKIVHDYPSTDSMSIGQAISSATGLSIVGAIITPDYTRFIGEWHGAIYCALLYAGANIVVELSGGFASIVFQQKDLLDIMKSIGLEKEAFAIVIAGSWIINAMNLYSLALSLEATFPTCRRVLVVGVMGCLGTLMAFGNILNEFLSFLFYLSIAFAPVAGVIVDDYVFFRRQFYNISHERPAFRPMALLAWMFGISIALAAGQDVIRFTHVAALDAFIAAAAFYHVIMSFSVQC